MFESHELIEIRQKGQDVCWSLVWASFDDSRKGFQVKIQNRVAKFSQISFEVCLNISAVKWQQRNNKLSTNSADEKRTRTKQKEMLKNISFLFISRLFFIRTISIQFAVKWYICFPLSSS